MKATKLMVAACVAAMALVSCNKEDDNLMTNSRMKSVEVSLKNVVITQTRGLAGDKISNGTPVKVSNFKVFLTDAAGNEYTAKNIAGTEDAQTWWSTADLSGGAINAEFHYVDPNCTKVIAVANIPNDMTFADYKNLANLKIGDEQNAQDLTLYAEATLTGPTGQHNDPNEVDGVTYVSDVYKADLTLKPRISRFEVDGFSVSFNATPKYNTIQITDMAFQNYYPETVLATGTETGELVNHMSDLSNQASVYNWFNDTSKETAWYWDSFDVTINAVAGEAVAGDTPNPLAYHMFSCTTAPVFVIKLLADNQPAYLYSKGFYSSTEKNDDGSAKKIENFEEGKIYRMSAAGEVANDGSIPIDDDDIDPMDRCLEITVDVVDWVVDLVYPEF